MEIKYTQSAFKHYAVEVIEEILSFPIVIGEIRKDVLGYAGFYGNNLIEVFVDARTDTVFHCDKASKNTKKMLKLDL